MKKIYITGHKHPDTDSIASSIAYAYLKRQLGIDAVACRLGDCNQETKYLLNRFDFDEPMYLDDARVRLNEIELEKPIYVYEQDTIFETLQKMKENRLPYIAVVNQNTEVMGMITRNDLADIGLGDTAVGIDLLKQTSLSNICKTIQGKVVYEDEQMHLNGKVSIVAFSNKQASNYEVKDRIVLIGDDKQVQMDLIQKGAGLLIVVWSDSVDEEVIEMAKEYHCPILISGFGTMNTSRYLFFSPSVSLVMKDNVMAFYGNEFLEEAARKMSKYRYRAYPVIDRKNQLQGYLLKDHAMVYKNKQIIMVDHNEFSQSVPNIEKAEILEVVDHHRIYDFYSSKPISFRNEIVGSSSTIIASIFKEKGISIPPRLAGLMLGAILSDTLIFQSPTCTKMDLDIADELEQIAKLNMDDLAYDMFFVSSNIENKVVSDFLREDVKDFEIDHYKVLIAQVIIPSYQSIVSLHDSIQEELEEYVHNKGYDLGVLVFTCVLDNGSYFYTKGRLSKWIEEEYPSVDGKPKFLEKVLSRKKQIVPMITEIIEKNI